MTPQAYDLDEFSMAQVKYWARCYRTDYGDALHELWIWQQEGARSPLELRTRIARQGVGVVHYGATCYRGRTIPVGDELVAPTLPAEDLSTVNRAFVHWVRAGVLSDASAEAIYRHYVDNQRVKDIADLYGSGYPSVAGHIRRGMERLRRVYEEASQ